MLIGCCVNMLPKDSGDPGAWYAPEIKQAGYDYIELPIGQVVNQSQVEFEEMAVYLRDVGLPVYACNNFFIREIQLVGAKVDKPRVRDFYQKALVWAQQLGCRYVVLGSPWSKCCPEGFAREKALDQMCQWCVEIGDEAEKRGIIIALEPNNQQENNLLNTFADVVVIAKTPGRCGGPGQVGRPPQHPLFAGLLPPENGAGHSGQPGAGWERVPGPQSFRTV